MNSIRLMRNCVLHVRNNPLQPRINSPIKRFRKPIYCDISFTRPPKRPCFNDEDLIIARGEQCHARMIKSFLLGHYWPREPSVIGLWMDQGCQYLDILTEKYAHSGDRYLAFEFIKRTGEEKLIGVSVANKVYPWLVGELEEWAHVTASKPERYRMYFCAHCLRSPNLFEKYKTNYIYDVEVLGTLSEVTGQGVATKLLKFILNHAEEMRYPLVQVVSGNHYSSKICERCGMTREWSMDYSEFVDDCGQQVFCPRRPHSTVSVYIKYFDPKIGARKSCSKTI